MKNPNLNRRTFLGTTGAFVAGSLMASPLSSLAMKKGKKIKSVLVGTGIRGTSFWGKIPAQIRYRDNTFVNYSLTIYSPCEGWKIAFNGTDGRIDAWLDIPFMKKEKISQSDLHELEISQDDQTLNTESRTRRI